MTNTVKEQELGILYARAREILITQGHTNVRYRREIIRLITANLGNEKLEVSDLLKLFVLSVSKNTATHTKLVKNRSYRYSQALIQAIERIPLDYPEPISMVSIVAGFQNEVRK
jgi:hypothetical protein